MIKFNIPPITGNEIKYINKVIDKNIENDNKLSYTQMCSKWIENKFDCTKTLQKNGIFGNCKNS